METKTIKKFIFPIVLLLLSSCYNINESKTEIPDNFFSKQKMIDVLTDMQIAEGALNFNRVTYRDSKDLKEEYYNQIFLKYDITALDFKENMNYYDSQPKLMEEILDKVLENLNQMQAKLEQKIADEKAEKDSLFKIYLQDSIRIVDSLNQLNQEKLPANH